MSLNIAVDVLHRPSPAAAVTALQHAYRAQIDALTTFALYGCRQEQQGRSVQPRIV